jgi:uncharacterized protein
MLRRSATVLASSTLLTVLVAFLGSCASYTQKTVLPLRQFEEGDFDGATRVFSDSDVVGSPFLRGAEAGMVALAAGQWENAQHHFDAAAEAVRELEERALLGAEELGEGMAALLVSESSAAYRGEGYERVQLHAALALTYMARGNLDGVYVEARRANKLLENEEELYEKKYVAGGLGHFVSATTYELQGRYDEAFIDYRRMDEKGVGAEIAGRALLRIASRLRYEDHLPELRERFGDPVEVPSDAASIVVIAGVGLGPFKVEQTVALPTPSGLAQVSVPAFVARPQPVAALELQVDGGAPLRTSVIESVSTVARENLHDRMAWLALRSTLRGAAKLIATDVLTDELRKQHGEGAAALGWIAGSIFTAATERADTRAWVTLPDSWQAARLFIAPGEHELSLEAVGGEKLPLGRFRIEPGETVFVLARTLGTRLYPHTIGGERLDAPANESATAGAAAEREGTAPAVRETQP